MPGTSDFEFDVFLSHSDKDDAIVRSLAERLRQDGLKVWLDDWVLRPGDSIPAKIEEGLEHSRVLVLCMSANAFGSDWAQLEAGTFRFRDPLNIERRFLPLRLDDAPIKGSLAQFAYIDWRPADREPEYTKLLAACRPSVAPMTDGTKHAGKDAIWVPETLTQQEPANASPDRAVVIAIGLFIVAIGTGAGWLAVAGLTGTMGAPLTVLSTVFGGISGFAFWLLFERYIEVLGTGGLPSGSLAREAYDRLRASLSGGNLASRLYAERLTKFLNGVDRFFGDAGKADQTLFPRAFGLKTPAPLWTAAAFDRCLLLALLYPIAAVFILWAVSGHVGPAEEALHIRRDVPGWIRGGAGLAILGFSTFPMWRPLRALGWISNFIRIVVVISLGIAGVFAAGAVAVAWAGLLAFALASMFPDSPAFDFDGPPAGFGALAVSLAFLYAVAVAIFVVPTGAGAVAFALLASAFALVVAAAATFGLVSAFRDGRPDIFLLLFLIVMTSGCLVAPYALASFSGWNAFGPLLLFVGLLTLVNAPFDWASLGLTRALLRRGLELGGWWPYFLALADALAAAVIIALLSITMVIGVQTFDHLAEHSGGVDARILPLDKLFDGIAAQPAAPEYWWVYALLLSTMIPSLLNLMIGGASLLRGIPGLPTLLLRFMPASKAVPAFDRTWLALVLTCQVFVGAFLGIAAQFVLAIGVIFYVLPWMGLELLDTARSVAEFDLPMRVMRGSP